MTNPDSHLAWAQSAIMQAFQNEMFAMKLLVRAFACCIALLLSSLGSLGNAAELTVSAASSLTNAMPELVKLFTTQHPGQQVVMNFGASGSLLQQIAKGAPVDVFLSADQETMAQAQAQGLVKESTPIARNALVLILPSKSALAPKQLADLAQASYSRIAIGLASAVPAGRYATQALQQAKVLDQLSSKLINAYSVRQVLDYVARGEVNAGFVFASDAHAMPEKVKIAFVCQVEKEILYPAARINTSKHPALAQQFVQFLRSPSAQAVLQKYAFLPLIE